MEREAGNETRSGGGHHTPATKAAGGGGRGRTREEDERKAEPHTWWQCSTDLMMPRKMCAAAASPIGPLARIISRRLPPVHSSWTRKMESRPSYRSCSCAVMGRGVSQSASH